LQNTDLSNKVIKITECNGSNECFLLSAFFDSRAWHFFSEPIITVLAVVHKNSTGRPVTCIISLPQGHVIASGNVIEFPDPHQKLYRPSYIHCKLPNSWKATWSSHIWREVSVSIHLEESGANYTIRGSTNYTIRGCTGVLVETNPIHPDLTTKSSGAGNKSSGPINYGFCVAPIRGDLYSDSLFVWLTHHLSLAEGRATFFLYNSSAGENTTAILNTLKKDSPFDLRVINWDMQPVSNPSLFGTLNENIWYNAQVLAINDCLFRMVGVANWVGIIDLDEYVVGRCSQANTLAQIMDLSRANAMSAGFMLQNAFFSGECKTPLPVTKYPVDGTAFRGSWFPHPDRSKMIVDPLWTYIQGIHLTHSFVEEHGGVSRKNMTVSPRIPSFIEVKHEIGAIHHYRSLPVAERNVQNCEESGLVLDTVAYTEKPLCS
jgi:hypothetical protein